MGLRQVDGLISAVRDFVVSRDTAGNGIGPQTGFSSKTTHSNQILECQMGDRTRSHDQIMDEHIRILYSGFRLDVVG